VPLLGGKTNDWPERILFQQHLANARAEKTGALRTPRFRLVNEGKGWEIFDMGRDPEQKRDASAEFAAEKQRLVAAYEAWWSEIKSGLPAAWPPPVPVGYIAENPVELAVPQANFTGGLRFSGKHPNNAWLVNWTNLEARVEWPIRVVRPGNYDVRLLYLAREADAGARVHVQAGASSAEAVTRATPIVQVPSPDRVPRDEVYEMEWHELSLGSIEFRRDATNLSVQALTRPGAEVMQLKAVLLERVP
jgi:hypothetical protein